MKIKLSRRSFSQGMLNVAASISATIPLRSHSAWNLDWLGISHESPKQEFWLSAQGRNQDQYGLGWINPNEEKFSQASAPFRGHGLCQNPIQPEQVILFSRRPGTQGIRLNLGTEKIDSTFNSANDRHMQGHGCFSPDGQILYCAESEISSGKGKVTLRDSNTLTLIGEFDSHGIGPHEIAMMPDGDTLVIANGGLLTHPDSGRTILNLESMRSSLTYINRHSGELISEHYLLEPKASIRHIDVADDGSVAIALQVQRKAMDHNNLIPLAAVHIAGEEIKMLHAPAALKTKRLHGQC